MSKEVLLIIGSNLGNKQEHIEKAIQLLSLEFNCKKTSSIYESKAWGYESENDFFNVAIILDCTISPHDLLSKLINIENKLGRKRNDNVRYMDRTIDIDIILFGDQIVKTEDLVIPHPRFHIRDFCLTPMKEIAPNKLVPGLNKTIIELANELNKRKIDELTCDKV